MFWGGCRAWWAPRAAWGRRGRGRLRVAARLAAFREDVIDLVARRNIFMARVRAEIEEKNFDRARELLETLDELPGRTQFNQSLDRAAQIHRTEDLQVQRLIDW